MLELQKALDIILAEAVPQTTSVPLNDAGDLILSQDLISPQAAPLFDNSAMDGFALCGEAESYDIVGEVAAGQLWEKNLESGQALRIMTGAALPSSCHSVVPIEEAELTENSLRPTAPVRPGQHIRKAGSEYQSGQKLLEAETLITPAVIGLLAAIGQTQVPVYKQPQVGIVTTGSELLPVEAALEAGKIRDSNSMALQAAVREAGAQAILHGILPDNRDEIRTGLKDALQNCDVLLTSGGVSVGDYDYVQEILLDLGLQKKFWKVAIKPGKPVLFGLLDSTLVFGIPGNPASALVVFEALIRPALRQMMGFQQLERPQVQGTLQEDVKAAKGRLHFLRVRFHDRKVTPFQGQGSSNLLSISQANALLPVYRDYSAGETVEVWRIWEK